MRLSISTIVLWMLPVVPAGAGDALAPPHGTELLLELGADGVQIYACRDEEGKARWIFQGPEAALFDARGRQVGTHGKGPTWTFFDGSSVIAEVTAKQPAPERGAVPWLLLTVKSHAGSGASSNAAFIRRIDTEGGVEPAEGCDAAHKGDVARMRYSATYQFFRN